MHIEHSQVFVFPFSSGTACEHQCLPLNQLPCAVPTSQHAYIGSLLVSQLQMQCCHRLTGPVKLRLGMLARHGTVVLIPTDDITVERVKEELPLVLSPFMKPVHLQHKLNVRGPEIQLQYHRSPANCCSLNRIALCCAPLLFSDAKDSKRVHSNTCGVSWQ